MHPDRKLRGPLFLSLGVLLSQLNGACGAEPFEASDLGEAEQQSIGPQSIGPQSQGTQSQGTQGLSLNGHAFSGATFNGKIPTGYQLGKAKAGGGVGESWYMANATQIVNSSTLSTITPSSSAPFSLTGVVRPTPGVTFSGTSGDTVNLRITAYSTDSTLNLFAVKPANPYASTSARSNSDVTLYKVEWQNGSTWTSVCPNGGEGVSGGNTGTGTGWAMFIRGTYSATATASELATDYSVPGAGAELTIACTNGAVAKCARQWGYKPWKSAPDQINGFWYDLRPFHQLCLRAARADYCSDGSSFTLDGTLIDMADSRGFVIREHEQSSTALFSGESSFSIDLGGGSPEGRNYCLAKTRYDDIVETTTCNPPGTANSLYSCDPYYGRSAYTRNPSNYIYDQIWVGSKDYCPHTTSETGAPLAFDCNYCTRRICAPNSENAVSATGTRGGSPAPSSTTGDRYCCTTGWDDQCKQEALDWCVPSVWSSSAEFTSWQTGDAALKADWYSPGTPADSRYDFTHSPKDYGPIGTAPFGTPAGWPASNSGARWIGTNSSTQETGYFRFRYRSWSTATMTVYIAATDTFTLYFNGSMVGTGSTPGQTYTYPLYLTAGKEHVVAVQVDKPGGGNAFLLDLR